MNKTNRRRVNILEILETFMNPIAYYRFNLADFYFTFNQTTPAYTYLQALKF